MPIRTSSPAACASASPSPSRCCTGRTLIVCDEPTTALDVSIQAQILAEMRGLVRDLGTALIWISHDLATVSSLASRILVMYAGRIIEEGPTAAVLRSPRHPYTRGLLNRCPRAPSRAAIWRRSRARTPSLLQPAATAARSARAAPRRPSVPARCPQLERHGARACRCHHPLAAEAAHERASSRSMRSRKRFAPRLSLGEQIAAALGSAIETRTGARASTASRSRIARARSLGLVGESGCGKSHARPHDRRHPAADLRDGAHRRRAGDGRRRAPASARRACRWCSRTRSPRSIRACASATRSPRARSPTASSDAARRGAYVGKWLAGGRPRPRLRAAAIRTSSPAASASASRSPARSPCGPTCWCATSRSPRSTCRSRRRSSTCSSSCGASSA